MHKRIADVLVQHNAEYKLRLHSECAQPINSPHDFAAALRCDVSRIAKTLLLQASKENKYCLAVAPANKRVDLNKVAAALGVSRLSMASAEQLKTLLDYPPTGVSPLGCGNTPVFIDESLLQYETILVGAGAVGAEIEIAPHTLAELCKATLLSLTA